jgi:transcriptional regulator with XRE-family HTH domain
MNVKKLRKSTGLRQAEFWSRVFVTQSGGCRYEQGRRVPKTVQALLTIAYGTKAQMERTLNLLRR